MLSAWSTIAEKTNERLQEKNLKIVFNQFKNDDSYVKAKANFPRSYWAFAHNTDSLWIELELKPKTKNHEPLPQDTLYEKIVQHKAEIEIKLGFKISCSIGGNDRRIKSYITSHSGQIAPYIEACVNKMVMFIDILQVYIDR